MHNRDDLLTAVGDLAGAEDAYHFYGAFQRVVHFGATAGPAELQPALTGLQPVLDTVGFGIGADLAQVAGSLAGRADDPTAVLPALVRRGVEACRKALLFAEAFPGTLPDPDDTRGIDAAREAFDGPRDLLEAWFTVGDWLQPVLFLMQRKAVREALPERDEITTAVAAIRDRCAPADGLHGLLLVLDDAPLLVLHRESGLGFRLTIGGIGDNFQLHTLLAATLIGEGRVPGEPLPPAMRAAATDGEVSPPEGIVGRFGLADAYGNGIWNEGRPCDIPIFRDERVIVLEPPSFHRRWNAGRAYPQMTPSVIVDSALSASEADDWLSRVSAG